MTQNVGSVVNTVQGLGSFLGNNGQQVFQSVTPQYQRSTQAPVKQSRDFIIMETSESAELLQLPPEILNRGDVSGVNDSDSSAIRTLQVLEEACHTWAKRLETDLQMICLTDKHALLALCPPSVRQSVAKYERAQKVVLGVLSKLVQRISESGGADFEMRHISNVLREATNHSTRHLMSKGFPVYMVQVEDLFFKIPNNALAVTWLLLSTGTSNDGRHLTAVATVQSQLLTRLETNWKAIINLARMVVQIAQVGGVANDHQTRLRTMFHVIVANLEALNSMGSGLSIRNFQRMVQCQRTLRIVRVPNLHHPAVSEVRRESRLLLEQLGLVVEELNRVNSPSDLVSMLQSYFDLEGVTDPLSVLIYVLLMLRERVELVYNAVENVVQTGTWGPTDDDIPVSEATMVEWLREPSSGTDLISPAEVSAGMQTLTKTNDLFYKRVMQLGVGMELMSDDKLVFGGDSVNVESANEQRVVDLLTGVEPSEIYTFARNCDTDW